jgi:hypothetical protein
MPRSQRKAAAPLFPSITLIDSQTAPGILPRDGGNWITLDNPPSGHQLSLKHLRRLVNAEAFAAATDRPLCAHITIYLGLAEGFTEASWSEFQTALFDKAARWLQRHDVPVAFAWVRENGSVKSAHVHWLVHVPFAMWGRFKTYLLHAGRFAVSDASGEAIRISGGRFGMMAPRMRSGVLRYVAKSLVCPEATMGALGIRPVPSLPVALQRVGVSHTISQLARKKAGWQELRTIAELHAHLHPVPRPANDNTAEAVHGAA